jgi:hypothetical protein
MIIATVIAQIVTAGSVLMNEKNVGIVIVNLVVKKRQCILARIQGTTDVQRT